MALISYYVARFIANTRAKSGPLPEAAQPALLFPGAGRRAELNGNGSANGNGASDAYGLAPFGCIISKI